MNQDNDCVYTPNGVGDQDSKRLHTERRWGPGQRKRLHTERRWGSGQRKRLHTERRWGSGQRKRPRTTTTQPLSLHEGHLASDSWWNRIAWPFVILSVTKHLSPAREILR